MSQPLHVTIADLRMRLLYASVDEAHEELPGVKSQEVQRGSCAKG